MDDSLHNELCSEDETPLVESLVLLDEAIRDGRLLSLETLPFELTETQQATWEAARTCLERLREVHPPRLSLSPRTPERVGRFHIERVLGAGGFGVVYLARDPFLGRLVALKVPRPHALFSADERRRFVLEARAASQLDHRHIVTTFEAGETDGLPYIAYAYCEGPTLAEWIRQQSRPVEPRLAATIALNLADAVSCSHDQGILHRDIKPANVLLDPVKHDRSDDFPFVAKLSDFGLAKLIEADLQATASSVMLGTPRYMAPEQTGQDQCAIGPATDVYGLGSVLYELLTKQPPFTAEAAWDVLTQVREYAPAAPRLIDPDIPRDLETIVLTCLEKDPADRYATAAELSADLKRFLNGEPIHARPTPPMRQLWMWCARHRLIAGLSGTILVSMMLLCVGLLIYLMQTTHLSKELKNKNQNLTDTVQQLNQAVTEGKKSQGLAEQHARELSETLYAIEVARAADAWRRGDYKTMAAALQPFATQPDLYEFGWRFLWRQQTTKELFRTTMPKSQYFVQFSPDGEAVAFAGADSVVRIYTLDDFRLLYEIDTDQQEINGMAIDPAGKWMATAGDDGTVAVWDLPKGTIRARYKVFQDAPAYQVEYCPAHQSLAVCGNSPEIHFIDLRRGVLLAPVTNIHQKSVEFLAVSPDGTWVLSGGKDKEALIWHLDTREIKHRFNGYAEAISSGAWWPDGRLVAIGSLQGRIDVWNAEFGHHVASRKLHDQIQSVAITPAGLLLVGDRGGTVTVLSHNTLSPDDNKELVPFTGWPLHENRVYGLAASPNDSRIASASRDGTVAVTELQLRHSVKQPFYKPELFWATHRCVAGPDAQGRRFGTTPEGFAMFSPDPGVAPQQMLPRRNVRDVSLNGDRLLAANRGNLLLWDLRHEVGEPEIIPVMNQDEMIYHLEWLDDEHVLVQCGPSEVRLWNLETNQSEEVWHDRHRLAVSPDRHCFALAEDKGYQLTLYDTATRKPVWTARGHSEPIRSLVFDSSGTSLFSGSEDRTIYQWDLTTGQERMRLCGHEAAVHLLAVSPDGRTLASCDRASHVRLWDLRAGRQLYDIGRHSDEFSWLEFTANGDELWGVDMWRAEHHWSCRAPTAIEPSVP